MNHTFEDLKTFLQFFGIEPGCPPISQEEFELLTNIAEVKFGMNKRMMDRVFGCFEIHPGTGKNFVALQYDVVLKSWEDLKKEFT